MYPAVVPPFVIANFRALGVKYVIWYRRIWTPSQGWHDYDGPSDHTDHVHVSFNDKPGTGDVDKTSAIGSALGSAASAIGSGAAAIKGDNGITGALKGAVAELATISAGLTSVGKAAELVTKAFLPSKMLRGAAALRGTLVVLIGIFFLSREARQ